MNELKIKGHSGCSLNVFTGDDGHLMVKKSCKESYIERLYKQYKKQLEASEEVHGLIKVPVPSWDEANNSIIMPYVHSMSFIEWIEVAGKDEIDSFINSMICYIDDELSRCVDNHIDKKVFEDKILSVNNACLKNELVDDARATFFCTHAISQLDDKLYIPSGICHGDLTLSNILFTNSGFYLIDFLDSFIETPLQDIVKLRQDTKYGWSLMMTDKKYNEAHVKTVLQYIDDKIVGYYKDKTFFYKEYYDLMQFVNILRILPYVKEKQVADRLYEILESIGE